MLKHVEYDDEWTEFVHAGWSRASILCIGLQIQESYSDIQKVSGTVFLLRILEPNLQQYILLFSKALLILL